MSDPGPAVTLLRHGETAWSRSGQHTSRSDLALTALGEAQARALRPVVASTAWDLVLSSPRQRARRTAELAGLSRYEVTEDLREWEYGSLEGLTTEQIHADLPGWSIWDGPWPDGETAADVAARADRVIARILGLGPGARVALVGHGHFSRVVAARWLELPAAEGRRLAFDTAALGELGWEHDYRVLQGWNVPAPERPAAASGDGAAEEQGPTGQDGVRQGVGQPAPGLPKGGQSAR